MAQGRKSFNVPKTEETLVNRKELNPDKSPEAAFGARLRSSREARNWTQDDLAARMEYSGRHISAIETGRKPPTRRFSLSVDAALGLEGTSDTFERAWSELKQGSLLEGFPEYLAQEARAAEIRLFEVGLIPGPLQTREYATALEAANVRRGSISAEQAAERVESLIERQASLIRPLAPVMMVVLDESCIRRPIGGLHVMGAQLERLIDFAEQPNTSLQVAPFAMGERRPFTRLVNLLTLSDRSVVSYVESQSQGYLERETSSVLPLVRAYHQLQTEAPSQAESVAIIKQARKGTPVTTEPHNWIKSSYSGNGGSCVEWAPAHASADGIVPVRDSKAPRGPVLNIPADAFTTFVAGVKAGELGTV